MAGEDDFGLCIQTYEAIDLTYVVKRDIVSAAEVSVQLYTGMALGARRLRIDYVVRGFLI